MEKRKYKNRTMWSEERELCFIKLWKLKYLELRSARKNRHIIEKMVEDFRRSGYNATVGDIKNKISNLTTKYKKEISKMELSGDSQSEWPLFEEMHKFLGNAKNIKTKGLVHESIMDDCNMQSNYQENIINKNFEEVSCNQVSWSSADPFSSQETSRSASTSPCTLLHAPTTSRAAKKIEYNFQKKVIKHMETMDIVMQNLVIEMRESNEIERKNAIQFEKYVNCMEKLTESMTDFLKRQP